jgi:hypothetical protein
VCIKLIFVAKVILVTIDREAKPEDKIDSVSAAKEE